MNRAIRKLLVYYLSKFIDAQTTIVFNKDENKEAEGLSENDDHLIGSLLNFELEYMNQNYASYFDESSDYANFILKWEVHTPNQGIIKGFHTVFGILLNATKGFFIQKSPEIEKQEICHVQVGSLIESDKAHDFKKNQ